MLPDHSCPVQIDRHKAAIVRNDLSRPVRLALAAGILAPGSTFFDYGCGHGTDVSLLAAHGLTSSGWDPHYFPDAELTAAEVVNLGYVINVIEHEPERRAALRRAWALAQKVLIVAAQVLPGEPGKGHLAYNDGLITSRNTFQKYYEQPELKNYIDAVLGVDAVPTAPGVYFVFRDERQAQAFRAARFRSRSVTPGVRNQIRSFDDYRPLLEPLLRFFTERGRLPVRGELENEATILAEFRSIARAFAIIEQATGQDAWQKIAEARRHDLLVYIALSRFGKRPNFTALPADLQQDIRAFWSNYTNACEIADKMLFSLGEPGVIAEACRRSRIGKFIGNALYVHISALDGLDPVLRLYEGAASRTFGRLEETTLIKFRADKPKVSWLYYPDFDTNPHPALRSSLQSDLQGLHTAWRDYSTASNPPILHRKETFVTPDYPLYEKFARLTAQEEKWGLLDDAASIGLKNGWLRRLSGKGARLQGHRLLRLKVSGPDNNGSKPEILKPT